MQLVSGQCQVSAKYTSSGHLEVVEATVQVLGVTSGLAKSIALSVQSNLATLRSRRQHQANTCAMAGFLPGSAVELHGPPTH